MAGSLNMNIPRTTSEHLGYIITPMWPTDFKLHNGNVVVQLSNKAEDLLLVHSDVLSKHSHYLACYLSPRWQTQVAVQGKDSNKKSYWRLKLWYDADLGLAVLVNVDDEVNKETSQLCFDHQDTRDEDPALQEGSCLDGTMLGSDSSQHDTRRFYDPHEGMIPARTIRSYKARYHNGEKMMDYYADLHRALFSVIYGLDLRFFPTTSIGTMAEFLADLVTLSDFYGTNETIGPLVQKMLWEDAAIGADVCREPAFYIALAHSLECPELLLETIKHAAGKERVKGGQSYCGGNLATVSDETKSLICIAQDQVHETMVEVYSTIMNAMTMTGEEQICKYLDLPMVHESHKDDEAVCPPSTLMQVYHAVAIAVGGIAQYIPYTAAYRDVQWRRACNIAQGVVLKVVVQHLWRPGHDSDYLPQGADAEFIYHLTQSNCWSRGSLFPPDLLRPIAATHRIAEQLLMRAIGDTLSRIDCTFREHHIWRVCKKYMQEDDRHLLQLHLSNFARDHEGQDHYDKAADVLGWWAPLWPQLGLEQDIDAVARAEHNFVDHVASFDLLRDNTIRDQPFDRWRSVMNDPDIAPLEVTPASRAEFAVARVAYFGHEGVTGRLEEWSLAQWPLFCDVLEAANQSDRYV